MNKGKWLVFSILNIIGWLTMGWGIAQGAVIDPISSTNTLSGATLTIRSVNDDGSLGVDITDNWLPEPNTSVKIIINNSSGTLNLQLHPSSTTNYRGTCTNFGLETDTGLDFELLGDVLVSNDCGGSATITVTDTASGTAVFTIPKDTDSDGMPDVWENSYGDLSYNGDGDIGPGGNSTVGDGISNIDEYRGFIISGRHVRTHPVQKDLFVYLVRTPQCGASTSILDSYFPDRSELFSNLFSLIYSNQIHILGSDPSAPHRSNEWKDYFVSFSDSTGNIISDGNSVTTNDIHVDRRVNYNAIYPVNINDSYSGGYQKGARIIECPNTSTNSMGVAVWSSINRPNELGQYNRAILYTQNIATAMNNLVAAGGTKPRRYSTFTNGGWTNPVSITDTELMRRTFQFYMAMEVGHGTTLTPTTEGTRKNASEYGYHHAPQGGSNMDQTIVNVLGTKYNDFYIPGFYSSTDLNSFIIKQQ